MLHQSIARTGNSLRSFGNLASKCGNFKLGRVCTVLGGQWGDEGKGKLADVLAENYDLVCRFNGGNNAGHTVIANGQKFAFHLLPCGLIYPHTQNLLGNGTVVHIESLFKELDPLNDAGIDWEGRLKLADRAHIVFDFHQVVDGVLEDRLADDKKIGTTRKGIGPSYAAKASRTGIRMGDLLDFETFKKKLTTTVEAHQRMYDFDYDLQADIEKHEYLREKVKDMIVDGTFLVNDAYNKGKNIICEAANAAMLDIDHGTYPFVTSSSTTIGGVCTGLGISPQKVDSTIGVVKAYTTRVGWGPFPTELTDDLCGGMIPRGAPGTEIGKHMQDVGAEYGVTTGRKRRCGWFDANVIQYGNMFNGYSSINLTKLDVLSGLEELKIGYAYELNGQQLPPGSMPATIEELAKAKVLYKTVPGWKEDISKCSKYEDLPAAAQSYVETLEELCGVPVSWIGVGPGRTEMVTKGFDW